MTQTECFHGSLRLERLEREYMTTTARMDARIGEFTAKTGAAAVFSSSLARREVGDGSGAGVVGLAAENDGR